VAPRQRSIRAVFEYSFGFLPPEAARLLGACSVFRGGFNREAALAVVAATPPRLQALTARSLLERSPEGRYHLHALLHSFAAEKLPDEALVGYREGHSRYYLQLFADPTAVYWHTRSPDEMAALMLELDNTRDAWQWASEYGELVLLDGSVRGLGFFLDRRERFQEGLALMRYACERVAQAREMQPGFDLNQLWAKLRGWHAYFLIQTGGYLLAQTEAEQAVVAAQAVQDREEEAGALWNLGAALRGQGHYQAAYGVLLQGLEVCRRASLMLPQALILADLGQVAWRLGQLAAARGHLVEAIQAGFASFNPFIAALSYQRLSSVAVQEGNHWEAIEHLRQALTITHGFDYKLLEGDCALRLLSVELHLGNYVEAQVQWERVQAINAQVSHLELQAFHAALHTRLRYAHDDYEGVVTAAEQAVALCRNSGEPYPLATVYLYLGHAHSALHHDRAASAAYREALNIWEQRGIVEGTLEPLAGLAGLALQRGEMTLAQGYVAQLLPLLPHPFVYHPAMNEPYRVYLSCYQVLSARHDSRARDICQPAAQRLRAEAQHIPDLAMRQHFFSLPLHQAILAAAGVPATA
jgi:tetratricopeptide (TPR) repeat protein